MEKKINKETINHLVNKMVDNKSIFSAVMKVENSEGSISCSVAAGSMQENSRYFIASVTKLYITAVVIKLIEECRISLNDKISKYLPNISVIDCMCLKELTTRMNSQYIT